MRIRLQIRFQAIMRVFGSRMVPDTSCLNDGVAFGDTAYYFSSNCAFQTAYIMCKTMHTIHES